METKVMVEFTIMNREGESSYDAKKRLCTLIDSELCHLADHEISVQIQYDNELVEQAVSLLDALSKQLSKDMINPMDRLHFYGLIQAIRDIVVRQDVIVQPAICPKGIDTDGVPTYEKSFFDYTCEIRNVIETLHWTRDGERRIVHEWWDQLCDERWKYSA